MTEKENNVRQAELGLKDAQAELKHAREALETGERKAKAIYQEEVAKLMAAGVLAQIEVERRMAWLSKAKADLEQPYTNSDQ